MKLPTILKQKKHCPSAILTKDNESVVHRPVWQAVVFFVIQGPQLSQYAFLMVTSHCCCLVPLHHLSNKPAQRYLISIFHSLCVCVCLCVCACACETCKPTFPHQWDYDFHMQTILPWNCQDKVTQYCLVTVWPFWKKSTNISLASPKTDTMTFLPTGWPWPFLEWVSRSVFTPLTLAANPWFIHSREPVYKAVGISFANHYERCQIQCTFGCQKFDALFIARFLGKMITFVCEMPGVVAMKFCTQPSKMFLQLCTSFCGHGSTLYGHHEHFYQPSYEYGHSAEGEGGMLQKIFLHFFSVCVCIFSATHCITKHVADFIHYQYYNLQVYWHKWIIKGE